MLTVHELRRQREAKARVNHETYKQLLGQVQGRIRARADNKFQDLMWQVPLMVPGRPLFAVSHAARYVSEKLRRGGFDVTVVAPQPDVAILCISWSVKKERDDKRGDNNNAPPAPPPPPPPPPSSRPAPLRHSMEEASRSLEKLKARLHMR